MVCLSKRDEQENLCKALDISYYAFNSFVCVHFIKNLSIGFCKIRSIIFVFISIVLGSADYKNKYNELA